MASLFKLTQNEYDFIMDIIRDTNPIKRTMKYQPIHSEEFSKHVFMIKTRTQNL